MNYEIINGRGVPINGVPFILEDNNNLTIEVKGLPSGKFTAKITNGHLTYTAKVVNGKAKFTKNVLVCGIWTVELLLIDNGEISTKILCAPITINNLCNAEGGYICYPSADFVLKELEDLKSQLTELIAWKNEVTPLIHEHKVTL